MTAPWIDADEQIAAETLETHHLERAVDYWPDWLPYARAVVDSLAPAVERLVREAKATALRDTADVLDKATALNPEGTELYLSAAGLRRRADVIEGATDA